MAKRLKLGKDISLKIRFTDNNLKNLIPIKVLIGGLVVALVTLSCAIGVLDKNDPPFNAPAGGVLWTPTPPLIFPTDRPIPTVTGDSPPVVESQAISTEIPTPPSIPVDTAPLLYYTQAGDTLPVIAIRFGVDASEIASSADTLPQMGLLIPNTLLIIPHRLVNTTSSVKILPDSELVYSPSGIDFDVEAFVNQAGGYLSSYREWLGTTQWTSGAEIVQRVALENSINPKLLLALLEYQSGWVFGQPANPMQEDYPMGMVDLEEKGLYSQLAWAVNQLSIGYYGWREGLLTDILFLDGVSARMAPDLNAGTVALQYYFAQIYNTPGWVQALDQNAGLPVLYERMFGNPWLRAMEIEPLYPPNLTQPNLILPFLIGQVWSYTGGPHGAWERDGARAAIDFAPGSTEPGCVDSEAWVVAAAPGLITRAGHGVIVEDLDGDGMEQTGWDVLYLHIADIHVAVGDWVETSDLLGHPSCEGGLATGTHVHIARKYNGEWIPADGPLPFILSGWTAHAGSEPYQGTLTKGSDTVPSSLYGARESLIMRTREDP